MKFGVLIFPGSNCDHDMIYVLRDILNQEVVELWHKDTDLQDCDAIAVQVVLLMEIICVQGFGSFSPIMKKVVEFAHNGA